MQPADVCVPGVTQLYQPALATSDYVHASLPKMPTNLLARECGLDGASVHLPHVRQNTKGGIYANVVETITAPLGQD